MSKASSVCCQEPENQTTLSARVLILLILFFGIAVYSNTFDVPFYYDDLGLIGNPSLNPPLSLGGIWNDLPSRFISNLSFAIQLALTGSALWAFHLCNLLIHLLTAVTIFRTVQFLFQTPALRNTTSHLQSHLISLAAALIFLTHPIQTEAVTYITQRFTSLATMFYMITLFYYLKARLENFRYYFLVCFFMCAAMFSKESSFTLPFAILITDYYFFPLSNQETHVRKVLRWLPFAVLAMVLLLFFYISSSGSFISDHGAVAIQYPRPGYLLTQFRVLRTYLRLLVFPVNQSIDYDYRFSLSWQDPDAWAAFSLLLSILLLALAFKRKYILMSFGVLWFFLTLSIESSFVPLKDVIVEHRLYLPMFGFAVFVSSLLWECVRGAKCFMMVTLVLVFALSNMTYVRNEVWRNPVKFWQETIKISPHKWRSYYWLGETYSRQFRDEKTALYYYHKALETGFEPPCLLEHMVSAYASLGEVEASKYFKKRMLSLQRERAKTGPSKVVFLKYLATVLIEEKKMPEAIDALKEALKIEPQNSSLYVKLGRIQFELGQEDAALTSFQQSTRGNPVDYEGYYALAFIYKKRGEDAKALDAMVKYLKCKKKSTPVFAY